MTRRNFSMQAYWQHQVESHTPRLHFDRQSMDWSQWHPTAYAKYMELLGSFPDPVPLDAEVESSVEDDGLVRERVVFNAEPFMSVPCQVLRPKEMPADGKNAAILCSHGHGPFGKDPVAGIRSTDEMVANIEQHNYDYGRQMAKAGYLTISPDLRGFGERRDGRDPFPGRDPCNVNYIRGTMTTFAAAAEPRIAAADILGYVNPWKAFAFDRVNFCGSQIVPGIYAWFDTDDIAGLIAPRPLMLDMGMYDDCFYIHDMLEGYERVKRIYAAAGFGDRLWKLVHPNGHGWGGLEGTVEFFNTYL